MDDDRDDIRRRSDGAPGGDVDRGDFWQGEHVRVELLSEYLDEAEAFGPIERATIDQHLAGCADCRATLEELRLLVAALAELPEPEPMRSFALTPELLDERDLPRPLDAERRPIVMQRTSAWRGRQIAAVRYATATAAVLFALVLGADLLTNSTDTGGDDDSAAMPETVQQQSFATDAAPTEDAQRNASTAESDALLEAPQATPADVETTATTASASQPTPAGVTQPAPQPTPITDTAAAAATATPAPATGGAVANATATESESAIAVQATEAKDDEEFVTTAPGEGADGDEAESDSSSRSGWRTLEIGLALLLASLLAALVVLPRLGARRGGDRREL